MKTLLQQCTMIENMMTMVIIFTDEGNAAAFVDIDDDADGVHLHSLNLKLGEDLLSAPE